MLHLQLAAPAMVAAALVAAGCGGSSKSGSTAATAAHTATTGSAPTPTITTAAITPTGKQLTRAQLIARGDAICAHTNTKVSSISIISQKEFARVIPQIAIYNATEANELGKLNPPASMTGDWTQILKDLQLYNAYTNQIAQYAQANNYASAGPLIHTAEGVHTQMNAVAKRDGFKHCSKVTS